MNNDFYRNRSAAVSSFFKKKTFLIILVAAFLLAIGSGILVLFLNAELRSPDLNPHVPDEPLVNSQISNSDTTEQKNEQVIPENNEPADSTDHIVYRKPVNAEVAVVFSGTTPVFSETLEDWRLHQGVDYLTDENAEIYASADGIVEDVYDDGLMGITVVILHIDGVKTIYQSLSSSSVIKGSEVFGGEVIGHAGITADAECSSGVHLHFAAVKNGVYIDPETLFEN